MKPVDRFKKYRDEELDRIVIAIRKGEIKSGKYAHRVKIDPDKKLKGKEFLKNEKSSDS